jgi:hypothetical protein
MMPLDRPRCLIRAISWPSNFSELRKDEVQLRETFLPRTRVNKAPVEPVIRSFIRNSSPCVSLLGVSSTQLDNSSFQATNHNEHRNHIALKLLAEGSVVVLVMALGWWGMWNLGSHTLVSQTQPDPLYVAGSPVSEPLQKCPKREGVGQGRGCSHEGSTHPISSRQPGVRVVEHARLVEHGHGAERHRDDRVPPRTSENAPAC